MTWLLIPFSLISSLALATVTCDDLLQKDSLSSRLPLLAQEFVQIQTSIGDSQTQKRIETVNNELKRIAEVIPGAEQTFRELVAKKISNTKRAEAKKAKMIEAQLAKLMTFTGPRLLNKVSVPDQIKSVSFDSTGTKVRVEPQSRSETSFDAATAKSFSLDSKNRNIHVNPHQGTEWMSFQATNETQILWRIPGAQFVQAYSHHLHESIFQIKFSTDGRTLFTAGSGKGVLYDLDTDKILKEFPAAPFQPYFSGAATDDLHAVGFGTGMGEVIVYDLNRGRSPILSKQIHDQPITALAISQDRQLILTGTRGGKVTLSYMDGDEILSFKQPGPDWFEIKAVAISPDKKKILVTGHSEISVYQIAD